MLFIMHQHVFNVQPYTLNMTLQRVCKMAIHHHNYSHRDPVSTVCCSSYTNTNMFPVQDIPACVQYHCHNDDSHCELDSVPKYHPC